MSTSTDPLILFTAFEASGDALAGPVVAALRERGVNGSIFACGGPRLTDAGAEMLERTTDMGAMGHKAIRRVAAFRQVIGRLAAWAEDNPVVVHVPVDSPAANFPISRMLKRRGASIVHLVAPQLWAWAPWRAAKLRRLTSQVLCVLPFEEGWFRQRSIPAKFIGHPAIHRYLDRDALRIEAARLPVGDPRVLLLPGSREHEVRANMPFLLEVFERLAGDHSGIRGIVVVARPELLPILRAITPNLPAAVSLEDAPPDVAMTWASLALAVSGTVSLDLTRHSCPMVGVYRTGRFGVALAKAFIRIPDLLLPNIVAGRRVAPEFIPWAGASRAVVEAARPLLEPDAAARQRADLETVKASFGEHEYAAEAAQAILEFACGTSPR